MPLSNVATQNILRAEATGKLSALDQEGVDALREAGKFPPPFRFPLSKGREGLLRGKRKQPLGREEEFGASPEVGRAVTELGLSMVGPPGVGALIKQGAARGLPFARRLLQSRFGRAGAEEVVGGGGGMALGAALGGASGEEIEESAAFGAGGGLAGRGLGSFILKALGPATRVFNEGGREVVKFVTSRGGIIPPGQVLENRLLNLMQNIAEGSFGGGPITAAKAKAADLIETEVNQFSDDLLQGLSREDIGEVVQHSVENGLFSFKSAATGAFTKLDNLLETRLGALAEGATEAAAGSGLRVTKVKPVNMSTAKGAAAKMLEEAERGLPGQRAQMIGLAKEILSKPNFISFADAQAIRGDLLAIDRIGTDLIKGASKVTAKRLAPLVDDAMETASKGLDKEALRVWRTANRFWKRGSGEFNSTLVKNLLKKDPELVVETFLRNRSTTGIRRVRDIVQGKRFKLPKAVATDPNAWKAVQGQFVDGLLTKAINSDGVLQGTSLGRMLRSFSEDSLKELFPNKTMAKRFKFLASALQNVQVQAGEKAIGRVAVQLAQPGAAIKVVQGLGAGLAGGGAVPGGLTTAATIVIAPPVLARIMASETGSRLLIQGIKSTPGTRTFNNVTNKLIAEANRLMFAPGGEK